MTAKLRFEPESSEPPSSQTLALQEEGGRLNAKELEDIRRSATLPPQTGGPSLTGVQAAPSSKATTQAASPKTAAYRFYNTRNSAHFYTVSEAERDQVIRELPFMSFEGPAFEVSASELSVLSPVYRFYNRQTGVHFYTISEAEKAHIIAKLPQFTFEGIAYHASVLEGPGYTPLYRFFLKDKGYHFYTASAEERDRIQRTLPQYVYEGIGYYVLTAEWTQPQTSVPHTGLGAYNCFNVDLIDVPCSSSDAQTLSNLQDGHRASINPMRYEPVPDQPNTDCVRDSVTGLVWELKTSEDGQRPANQLMTNDAVLGGADALQYALLMNYAHFCGFDDWRIPTAEELLSLYHFGNSASSGNRVSVDANVFPHTAANWTWTSTLYSSLHKENLALNFQADGHGQMAGNFSVEQPLAVVRLVRGSPVLQGVRTLVTTKSFPGDAANNAVLDRASGFVWRRCLLGQRWTGSACEGTAQTLGYVAAMQDTRNLGRWRLPNIRELASLLDRRPGRTEPIDRTLYQGGPVSLWSTTVNVRDPRSAYSLCDEPLRCVRAAPQATPATTLRALRLVWIETIS